MTLFKLFMGSWIILALVVWGLIILWILPPQRDDAAIVASLEANVLPYIQEKNVTKFDAGWCKRLTYNDRTVSRREPGATSPCSGGIFTEEDTRLFEEIKARLSGITEEGFGSIKAETPSMRPEHSYLTGRTLGLGFHIMYGFCRTRYVYWPDYTQLPPNIESEIRYIPINKDWYRVEEDWN